MTVHGPSIEPLHPAAPAHVRPRQEAPVATQTPSGSTGRLCLALLDGVAVASAWIIALLGIRTGSEANGQDLTLVIALLVPAALALQAAQHLYRCHVFSVRSVETQLLVRTSLLTGAGALALAALLDAPVTVHDAAVGAGAMFLLLRCLRSGFGGYLKAARRRGRFCRRVLLVGANEEARDLYRLVGQHPELGYQIVGIVSDGLAIDPFDAPLLGNVSDIVGAVASSRACGVMVAATAVDTMTLNRLTRDLTESSVHVYLSSGIRGIAQSRIRPQPLAHEPLFYVEPADRSRAQWAAKRATDIVLAGIALILALPVLLVAAVAIKLEDRGPVLFRQVRVGLGGRWFTMFKLRTMKHGSEALYDELAATNAGRSGPLVKLRDDPRITRVGRFLRASSIDELPQLVNVLTGRMSMVGPRPNLLCEAAGLDVEFAVEKCKLRPGLTGLWQVEARDNPSFEVYRRLDLFYVENWSMAFDLRILLTTSLQVLGRPAILLVPRWLRPRFGLVTSAAIQ